jgi:hypothetical protein
MMGRTWGRLYLGTRNHRKIKTLRRRHPGSWKTFYVLLEMALETDDDGWIYLEPGQPYPLEELADEVDETPENLQTLLGTMADLGMIQVNGQGIQFLSYSDRQFKSDADGAERVRRHRAAKKPNQPETLQPPPNESTCNSDVTLQDHYCNGGVTPPDTETDTETDSRGEALEQTNLNPKREVPHWAEADASVFAGQAAPPGGSRPQGVFVKGGKGNGNGRKAPRASPPLTVSYPEDFLRFWEAYPRKTGKREALRRWLALKKDGALPDLTTLLGALKWQKEQESWRKDGGQFIPHPATWLNAGRWDDEPPPGVAVEWESQLQADPNCPRCHGDGWEYVEEDGDRWAKPCRCTTAVSGKQQAVSGEDNNAAPGSQLTAHFKKVRHGHGKFSKSGSGKLLGGRHPP